MTRTERRRLVLTLWIGLGLTLAILVLHLTGLLTPLERWAYDQRARWCQFFLSPPTEQLVHVNIDDRALEVIGRWPWPRDELARIIETIADAEPKAIGLDILFPEPAPEEDPHLARAIDQAGNVAVPLSLTLEHQPIPPLERDLQDILERNPKLSPDGAWQQLERSVSAAPQERVDTFLRARRRALFELAIQHPEAECDELRRRLLSGVGPPAQAAERVLKRQYRRARSLQALSPHTRSPPEPPLQALPADGHLAPVQTLGGVAANTGFVDYRQMNDGVVRRVPLWARYRDRLYPHLALSLACMAMEVSTDRLTLGRDHVTIPRPDAKPLRIPTYAARDHERSRDNHFFFDIPWFGPTADWTRMYDHPANRRQAQHMSAVKIWSVLATRDRIRQNNQSLDQAIKFFYEWFAPDKLENYEKDPPPLDDFAKRAEIARSLRENQQIAEYVQPILKDAESNDELPEAERQFVTEWRALRILPETNRQLQKELAETRSNLRKQLEGKVVLFGWTATGAAADFVSTSLHPNKAPGVVVHGTILNGILSGELWRRAAPWVDWGLIVLFCGLVTVIVAVTSPVTGSLITLTLMVGWTLVNALLVFDYGNLILPLGTPLTGMACVWLGTTGWRYLDERAERARVTRRFRSYVDPALVHYVLEHPETAQFTGETRELTVVFTDLAGFTTLSERLGTDTVPMLNRYMGYMVPLIRARGGYVNKFLGDGIMFFYGAPWPSQQHAAEAVQTVLDMHDAMGQFNRELTEQGLPNVHMRAGIASGPMVVGDAGPPEASDYTALGDTVNLAARLEPANKSTGTQTIITERTRQLLGGMLLTRPLGSLQVVGKTEGVMVHEPIAYTDRGTDRQHRLCEQTRHMVELYQSARFAACEEAADQLDETFGPSKLTELYRQTCRQYLTDPPVEFAGHLVLTEK